MRRLRPTASRRGASRRGPADRCLARTLFDGLRVRWPRRAAMARRGCPRAAVGLWQDEARRRRGHPCLGHSAPDLANIMDLCRAWKEFRDDDVATRRRENGTAHRRRSDRRPDARFARGRGDGPRPAPANGSPRALAANRGGIIHLACAGETSWRGFAEEIFRLARVAGLPLAVKHVAPITTAEYPTPARRPLNSRLDCALLAARFGLRLSDWREALAAEFPAILAQLSDQASRA